MCLNSNQNCHGFPRDKANAELQILDHSCSTGGCEMRSESFQNPFQCVAALPLSHVLANKGSVTHSKSGKLGFQMNECVRRKDFFEDLHLQTQKRIL